MRLAQFITDNIQAILVEWEAFAQSLPPGQNIDSDALRDDAERMLRFVAADMETAQSDEEGGAKARGQKSPPGSEETAAQTHGRVRLAQAFDLPEMVSEFRALRASVLRLWSAQGEAALNPSEMVRFNEAIDQILAESVQRYASDMERSRELLLAVLGHDLRNPLSSIRMSAEVLAQTDLTARQNQLTDGIIRASERMRKMIHDLLDFTRTRLGAKLVVSAARCDLADVCRSIGEEARLGHPDREVSVASSGDCLGQWDCARMAQLVSNLVGNAVQHGDENSPVEIVTLGDDPAVVTLTVGNQGPAIPPERRVSIFDPLNRNPAAKDRFQAGSLGLGLYIAREIALAHGGSISLLSSDEAGTVFEARLPRMPAVE